MTVITKPITEKKAEKQEQPLVAAEVLPSKDVEEGLPGHGKFVEGSTPLPSYLGSWSPPRGHRRSTVPTVCLLLLALFVMSVGIITGLYVYKQFARPSALRYSFRGSCPIPFDEGLMASAQNSDLQFADDSKTLDGFPQMIEDFPKELLKALNGGNDKTKDFLREDVEIDSDEYEKITVPDMFGSDRNRFIHDFNVNLTGIIDLTRHHCFIMPLNRSQILPPNDLMDLIQKMWGGYYELNSNIVRETMRVVLPAIEDRKNLGQYIQRECEGYPIYRLEKLVSGVTKRSVQGPPLQYVQFAGQTSVLNIVNMEDLDHYEKSQ